MKSHKGKLQVYRAPTRWGRQPTPRQCKTQHMVQHNHTENALRSPWHPGVSPQITAGTTAIKSYNDLRKCTEQLREWREWRNIERSMKKQLPEAVTDSLLYGAKGEARTYNIVQVWDTLGYLFIIYSKFDQQYLINNRNHLTEEWDPNWLFRDLTKSVQHLQEIATSENCPINDQGIIDTIYTIILNTGLLYNNSGKWNNKTSICNLCHCKWSCCSSYNLPHSCIF